MNPFKQIDYVFVVVFLWHELSLLITFTHSKLDPVAAISALVPVQAGRTQLLAPAAAHAHQIRVTSWCWCVGFTGTAFTVFWWSVDWSCCRILCILIIFFCLYRKIYIKITIFRKLTRCCSRFRRFGDGPRWFWSRCSSLWCYTLK